MISSATANPVLQGLFIKFMQDQKEFAASALFPLFRTALQSAQYYVFDAANMLNIPRDLQHAPGDKYNRTRMKLSDDTFICREFGLEEPVPDSERKKYAIAFDADAASVRRLSYAMLFNWELRAQALAATLAANAPQVLWDDYQTSNPVLDIDAGREAIHNNIGLEANLLVIPRVVFNSLKEHPKILDKIKYTQEGVLTPELLQGVFNIEKVFVAGGIENTAAEGQAVAAGPIWGKDAYLAHVESSQDLMAPSFGRTFAWTEEVGVEGYLVESYRDEDTRSDIHRARQSVQEKILGSEAAYRLANVIQ